MPFSSKSSQRRTQSKPPLLFKRRPRIKTKSKGRLKRGAADMPTIQTQLHQLHSELEKNSAYKLPAEKLANNLTVHLRYLAESLPNPQPTIKMASVLEETGNLRTALDQAFPAYTAEKKAELVMSLLKSLDNDMKKMALAQRIKSAMTKQANLDPARELAGLIGGMGVGGLIGGGIGAVKPSNKGQRMQGTGRGAITGMGVGGGMHVGGLAGQGLGGLLGSLGGRDTANTGALLGHLLGTGAGGLMGYGAAQEINHPGYHEREMAAARQESEARRAKQGEAMDMNMGEGMASPEDPMQMQNMGGQPQPGAPTSDPTMAGAQPPMMPPGQEQPMAPPQPMQQQPPMQPPPPQVPGAVPPPPNDQPLPPQALQPTPPSPTDPAQEAMFGAQGMGGPGGAQGMDPASAIMSDLPDAISNDKMGSFQERLAKAASVWGIKQAADIQWSSPTQPGFSGRSVSTPPDARVDILAGFGKNLGGKHGYGTPGNPLSQAHLLRGGNLNDPEGMLSGLGSINTQGNRALRKVEYQGNQQLADLGISPLPASSYPASTMPGAGKFAPGSLPKPPAPPLPAPPSPQPMGGPAAPTLHY